MVPVAFTVPQPPVNGILYLKVPATVGVPLMVMVLAAQLAETPAGKPFAPDTPLFDIPVAPVVVRVMVVNAVLIHKDGVDEGAPAIFAAVTVIVPVAVA